MLGDEDLDPFGLGVNNIRRLVRRLSQVYSIEAYLDITKMISAQLILLRNTELHSTNTAIGCDAFILFFAYIVR
jgi:hypothetical protein